MRDKPKSWNKDHFIPFAILGIILAWSGVVFASAVNYNLFNVEWNFQRTALLGDSFGVVGSVMATMAAVFTFIALRDQRYETRRLRDRESDRDKSDRKRESEATFFQLLNLRNTILDNIVITGYMGDETLTGQRSLRTYFGQVAYLSAPNISVQRERYNFAWVQIGPILGHYLRFTYHIIRFADESFETELVRYEYIRLLRAQLSNAELGIIAMNCAHGDGHPKMKKYVERYGLFHSLPDEMIAQLHLKDQFADGAFDTDRWDAMRKKDAPAPPPAA